MLRSRTVIRWITPLVFLSFLTPVFSKTYVVTVDNAPIYSGDYIVGYFPAGTELESDHANGNWRVISYSDPYGQVALAWIDSSSIELKQPAYTAKQALSGENMIKLGLPSPFDPWTGDDYLAAAELFKNIIKQGVYKLPRRNDPFTSAIFIRIIDIENFEQLSNPHALTKETLADSLKAFLGLASIVLQYTAEAMSDPSATSELAEITVFTMHLTERIMALVDLYYRQAQNSGAQLNHAQIDSGFEQIREGARNMIFACLASLDATTHYGIEARRIIARGLADYGPSIYSRLTKYSKKDFKLKLRAVMERATDHTIINHLRQLDRLL